MHMDHHIGQRPRHRDRLIPAPVVHDDDQVNDPLRHHLVVSLLDGARCIESRHHHDDLLAVEHHTLPGWMLSCRDGESSVT